MIYIPPNIKIFISYDEFKKYQPLPYPYGSFDKFDNIENIFDQNRLIILGEPGYGKTELLNKIIENSENSENSENDKYESIFIDLKNIDLSLSLEKNIKLKTVQPDAKKTSMFKLKNIDKVIICLDALDEVKPHNLSIVFEKIKNFIVKFSKIKIYISCRRLYFETFENMFLSYGFNFLGIYSFNNNQIYNYLNKNSFSQNDIDLIFKDFFNNQKHAIIQTPRYLSLFVDYLKEKGISNLQKLRRIDIFEYFIYKKLEKESLVTNKQNLDIVKRTLEKLALTMEINQTNRITKDELMTIFGEISDNLIVPLLSQYDIDEFFDKSLLKNNIDYIEFDNTEFQEYLAAKELSRFSKLQQSIFDLVVMKEIREIYPSWFNVLNYLVEFKIDLLKSIIDFGMNSNDIIDKDFFHLITNANVNLLSDETKNQIFEKVFTYYQNNKLSIEFELEKNLSYYYTDSNFQLLKKYVEKNYESEYENHILIRNVFWIVFNILDRGKFNSDERKFWKEKAFSIILESKENNYLRKELIYILRYLGDKIVVKEVREFWKKGDKQFRESLLNICIGLEPNNLLTLEFIIEGLRNDYSNTLYGITQMTSLKTLIKFYSTLNTDDHLIARFYEEVDDKNNKKILENINRVADKSLLKILETFICRSYKAKKNSYMNEYGFQLEIAKLISQKDKSFIFRLIKQLSNPKEVHQYQLPGLYSRILKKSQVKKFIKEIEKIDKNSYLAIETLLSAYSKSDTELELIYEEGRKYFLKDYKETEQRIKKYENENNEKFMVDESKFYEHFKILLDLSSTKKFYDNIFDIYSQKNDFIEKFSSKKDKNKFTKLVSHVLSTFDPLTSELKITQIENSSTSYSTHPCISFYGYCIICADILGIDVKKFKQNIINYIPFSYDDVLQSIFKLVKTISSKEIQPILEVYKKKKDDLWKFMPENFLSAVEKYSIKEALPIIKEFIEIEDSILKVRMIDYQVRALNLYESINPDSIFLMCIFSKYQKNLTLRLLTLTANSLLIEKYQDEKAIKWRMKETINRAFPNNERHSTGIAYTPTSNENELREKRFISPLMKVTNLKYEKLYLDFLNKSFEVQNTGQELESYGHYMRDAIINYYDNLKFYNSFKPLDNLEREIRKFESENGYGWLFDNLRILKRKYIEFIGKPDTILDSVLKYNAIKNKEYEKISTSKELFDYVKNIIQIDLNNWVKGEGIKIISDLAQSKKFGETSLQKILKIQFENFFLKSSFRKEEINIHRESQLLDDKRTDFLIGYGFVNPILIELKLSSNTDLVGKKLNKKKSFNNLKQYVTDCAVDHSILLIYENKKRKETKWIEHINKIKTFYYEIRGVEVIGIPIK